MTNPVKAFLTVLGATIIASVKLETADLYDLEGAFFFQIVAGQQPNAPVIQFTSIHPGHRGDPTKGLDMILQTIHVVAAFEVNDELEKAYLQQVSHIALAGAGTIAQLDMSKSRP